MDILSTDFVIDLFRIMDVKERCALLLSANDGMKEKIAYVIQDIYESDFKMSSKEWCDLFLILNDDSTTTFLIMEGFFSKKLDDEIYRLFFNNLEDEMLFRGIIETFEWGNQQPLLDMLDYLYRSSDEKLTNYFNILFSSMLANVIAISKTHKKEIVDKVVSSLSKCLKDKRLNPDDEVVNDFYLSVKKETRKGNKNLVRLIFIDYDLGLDVDDYRLECIEEYCGKTIADEVRDAAERRN